MRGARATREIRKRAALRALAMALAATPAVPAAASAGEAEVVARLRAAAEARAAGQAAAAARGFAAAADAEPALADDAGLLAAEVWLEDGRPAEAEAAARRALARDADTPLAGALLDVLANARAAQGDATGARAAWREALARGAPPGRSDAIRIALADSLAEAGQPDAAAAALRTVWTEAAARPEGDIAERRLAALEARSGRSWRSPGDQLQRADRLYAAQHSEAALAAYEAALARGLGAGEAARARRRRADCLFRLRRYPEAEIAFGALAPDPDARVWQARALARSDRVEQAVGQLEAIGREGHGETSAWARLLAGLLHEGRGRTQQARTLFAAAADGGSPQVATEALWRLGWGAYAAGDFDTARRRLQALAAQPGDPLDRLGARYWAARAREAADPEEARRELRALAAAYPLSYYGWRAGLRAPAPPAPGPPIADGAATLGPQDLAAPRLLAAAGLDAAALRALAALADRAANVADRIAVAQLYAAAGQPSRAQALVIGPYAGRLARGVAPGQEALWQLAWPDAYAAERRRALPPGASLDPWLVAAVMREESGYRPDAVSVTGALGLLQLMPETASRLARDAGLAGFAPSQLVQPEVNLRLGTLLLDRLVRRFEGALEPAIASYNAGPEAVAGWRAGSVPPPDVWVETIPYDQTRHYVKRVQRSQHAYRTLYR